MLRNWTYKEVYQGEEHLNDSAKIPEEIKDTVNFTLVLDSCIRYLEVKVSVYSSDLVEEEAFARKIKLKNIKVCIIELKLFRLSQLYKGVLSGHDIGPYLDVDLLLAVGVKCKVLK